MPFCPICAEEYEQGIIRCADCGARLVPELPEPDVPTDGRQPAELIRSRDPELIQTAGKHLFARGLACQVIEVPPEGDLEAGYALILPAGLWTQAVEALTHFLDDWYDPHITDATPPPLPESLNRPLKNIIDDGHQMLPDLAKALLVGDRQARAKAEYALVKMGRPASELLTDLLIDAIQADDPERVRPLARTLAKFDDPEAPYAVLSQIDRHEHLITAVSALGCLKNPVPIPKLVELLDHEDEAVRDEAAESLYTITGKTFDFEADDPPETRRASTERWADWMRTRGLI